MPDHAGIPAGMHESRKMWQPEPMGGSDEQRVKDGISPSRAEYGEHWDKKGPSRALSVAAQTGGESAKDVCRARE